MMAHNINGTLKQQTNYGRKVRNAQLKSLELKLYPNSDNDDYYIPLAYNPFRRPAATPPARTPPASAAGTGLTASTPASTPPAATPAAPAPTHVKTNAFMGATATMSGKVNKSKGGKRKTRRRGRSRAHFLAKR